MCTRDQVQFRTLQQIDLVVEIKRKMLPDKIYYFLIQTGNSNAEVINRVQEI